MSRRRPWEVWFAYVYYEDMPAEGKRRPVVILDDDMLCVTSAMVTTHKPRSFDYLDYELRFWKEAGLSCPSVVRLEHLRYLNNADFDTRIGRLQLGDISAIQQKLGSRMHTFR